MEDALEDGWDSWDSDMEQMEVDNPGNWSDVFGPKEELNCAEANSEKEDRWVGNPTMEELNCAEANWEKKDWCFEELSEVSRKGKIKAKPQLE